MNHEFMEALDELEKDRGIDKEILIDTIEQALLTAYKKNFGSAQNVRVEIDRERGDVRVFSQRVVVDESDLYDTFLEIELNDAREISPNYELGDIIENEVTPKDFGRIAAQTAKQVVVQRIREAEREIVYNEFMDKENEIVTGEVARVNKNIVYVNLGRIEAIMTQAEQIPGEHYQGGYLPSGSRPPGLQGQQRAVLRLRHLRRQVQALLQRRPAAEPGALFPVLAGVDAQPHHPRPLLAQIGEATALLYQLDEHRLADVLGVVHVPQPGVADAEDGVGVPLHQLLRPRPVHVPQPGVADAEDGGHHLRNSTLR